jgi:hypothetical protein
MAAGVITVTVADEEGRTAVLQVRRRAHVLYVTAGALEAEGRCTYLT